MKSYRDESGDPPSSTVPPTPIREAALWYRGRGMYTTSSLVPPKAQNPAAAFRLWRWVTTAALGSPATDGILLEPTVARLGALLG